MTAPAPAPEERVFLQFDERSEHYFVGRITRRQDEVRPELWDLPIGGVLIGTHPDIGWMREK